MAEVEVRRIDERDVEDEEFDERVGDGDWLLLDMPNGLSYGNECRWCHMVTRGGLF